MNIYCCKNDIASYFFVNLWHVYLILGVLTEVWQAAWSLLGPSEGNYLGIYRTKHLQVQGHTGIQVGYDSSLKQTGEGRGEGETVLGHLRWFQ